ncbi:MAG: twitching motility protein PilT [Candidatus Dormibacteria bacterium]
MTYDSGALVAAERGDRRMWALHAGFLAEEVSPIVSAPVLAQAWRGGPRQANLVRCLALCDVEAMTADQARRVGVLAAAVGHRDIVALTVVEGAARRGDGIVTADTGDITDIVRAARLTIMIEQV